VQPGGGGNEVYTSERAVWPAQGLCRLCHLAEKPPDIAPLAERPQAVLSVGTNRAPLKHAA